jgi:hypothetical protein
MLHRVDLYNTLDDALLPIDQLDGFGQNIRQVSPIQNGVIYETASHFSHRLVLTPAANDGVGWGVWDGDFNHGGDVPRAAWSARTVGASAAGDWYLAFSLQDTGGDGMLHDVATFALTGITFDVPVTLPDQGTIVQSWRSPTVDLKASGFTDVVMPANAGKLFTVMQARIVVETQVGAAIGVLGVALAQNGADVGSTLTVAAATANTFPAPYGLTLSSLSEMGFSTAVHALQLHVSTPITGPTSCTGHLEVMGFYL